MKIFQFLLVALIFSGSVAFSQEKTDFEIYWGEFDYDSPRLAEVIEFNNNDVILLSARYKMNKTIYTIERKDKYLITKETSTFQILNDRKSFYFAIKQIGNELFLFTIKINGTRNTKTLFAQRVNSETLEVSKETVQLAQVNFKRKHRSSFNEFKIECSPNKKLFSIYSTPLNDELANNSVNIAVYTNSLKPTWKSSIKKEKESSKIYYRSALLSNSGDVYIHAVEELNKDQIINKRDPKTIHTIYALKNNGVTFNQYDLAQEGKTLINPKISLDTTNGHLLLGGFYTNARDEVEDGYFLTSINTLSGKTKFTKYHPFDLEFIKVGLNDWEKKQLDKKKVGIRSNFTTKQIISTTGEGYVITGEYLKLESFTSGIDSKSTVKYKYYHNDIVVFKLNSKGEKVWHQKIIKRQYTGESTKKYASYSFFEHGNKLHFIYNELAKAEEETNIQTGDISTFSSHYELTNAVMVSIDQNGKSNKQVLFDTDEMDMQFAPHHSDKIWENKLLLAGPKSSSGRFGILLLNK